MNWQDLDALLRSREAGGQGLDAAIAAQEVGPLAFGPLADATTSIPAAMAFLQQHLPGCDFRIERCKSSFSTVVIEQEVDDQDVIAMRITSADEGEIALAIVSGTSEIMARIERAAELGLTAWPAP